MKELDEATYLRIVKFAAEECQRQRSEPISVYWMVSAWLEAMQAKAMGMPLDVCMIESWGMLIEPVLNRDGFRQINVQVGYEVCPDWKEVPKLMQDLVKALPTMKPDEAYLVFVKVHPLKDGNGRCAKILYAYLRNELEAPTMPPNFFDCANP